MKLAHSRLTAQGQVSVPAEVRKRLGLAPGSVIEWDAEGDAVTVQRVGRYTSADVHSALFEDAPSPRTLAALKEGVRASVKARHAKR